MTSSWRPNPSLVLLVTLCFGACAGEPRAKVPRNLLIVTLDTLRSDHLGCYGYGRPTSPHLDAFAARATRFADVTCSMPTTLPSHLTILTGLTPAQHGVRRNGIEAPTELESIFERLASTGRRTAAIVAAGVLDPRFLTPLGLDEIVYDGSAASGHQVPAEQITDRALTWLGEHGGERFALWVHYFDPHEPYEAPLSDLERFIEQRGEKDAEGVLPDHFATDFLVDLNRRETPVGQPIQTRIVDVYDAQIAYLDRHLGRLLRHFYDTGLASETVIVVVGDHGQALGEHGRWGHGEWLLEPIVQTPLLVRLPGQEEGRVISTPVETLDLMPTLAALFGVETAGDAVGRSLVAALTHGDEPAPRRYRLIERRSYPQQPERRAVAVHRGGRKLVYVRDGASERLSGGRRGAPGGLDADAPLGAAEASGLRALVEALDAAATADEAPPEMSAEVREMLRALGYID